MYLAGLPEPWRAGWAPFARALERGAARLGLAPLAGLAGWLADDLEIGRPPSATVEQAIAGLLGRPLAAEPLVEGPFARLVRLGPTRSSRYPRILLVAPCSGYAASVLAELAALLLEAGELALLEWRDARLVPVAHGPFGAAEQAAETGRAVARFTPDLVVAVSQAGDAALAATLAARRDAPPRGPAGLVLLGTPCLPERDPTPLQRTLALVPEATLAALCLAPVSGNWPGAGRRVFPGRLQLSTVAAADPWIYGAVRIGAIAERLEGRAGPRCRALADLHALQDVPGELWLDLVARLRGGTPALSEAAREASRGLALLTVEAEADALVGPGQTHGLHERLAAGELRAGLTLPAAGHHDLFTGARFRAALAPRLLAFVARVREG